MICWEFNHISEFFASFWLFGQMESVNLAVWQRAGDADSRTRTRSQV